MASYFGGTDTVFSVPMFCSRQELLYMYFI